MIIYLNFNILNLTNLFSKNKERLKQMKTLKNFLSFALLEKEGRINRSAYIVAYCCLSTVVSVLLLAAYTIKLKEPTNDIVSWGYLAFMVVVVISQLYFTYNLNLKRAYDISKGKLLAILVTFSTAIFASVAILAGLMMKAFSLFPGLSAIVDSLMISGIIVISIIYFVATIILVFRKSTDGENSHGISALENEALKEFTGFIPMLLTVILNASIVYTVSTVPYGLEDELITKQSNSATYNWEAKRTEYELDIDKYIAEEFTAKLDYIEDEEKITDAEHVIYSKLKEHEKELDRKSVV